MLQAYIDESGVGQGDLFVLAGYIAPAEVWAEKFTPAWDRLLALGPPNHRKIDAFKMSEMLDQPEQSSWFYREIENSVVAEVSCVISRAELYAAYREFPWPFRFKDDGPSPFTNPYYYGFQSIIKLLAQKQRELHLDEPIDFVFDERAEKIHCLHAWDSMKIDASFPEIRDMLGDTPIFRPDAKVLPLQAADLLAYWAREWSYQGVLGDLDKMKFPWDRHRKIPGAAFRLTKETFLAEFEYACRPESLDRLFKGADHDYPHVFFSGSTSLTEGTETKAMSELQLSNSENVKPVYANSVSTTLTQFDIQLVFSEIVPNSKGGATNELKAHVILTPAHARSVATLLAKTVENYERNFGKVEQPNPVAENALS